MADLNFKLLEQDNKFNCRIEELQEEEQLIIVRLVNHMASLPDDYRKSAFKRLLNISKENPWVDDIPDLDKESFLKNHPLNSETAHYNNADLSSVSDDFFKSLEAFNEDLNNE